MFQELLVPYGITEAAFSYTVFKSLQMSLSDQPCVFSQALSNLPGENLGGVSPNTADHQLIL